MKKKASFITINSLLAKWIKDEVSKWELQEAREILQGMQDLVTGEISTLMISMEGNTESAVESIDDGICVREITIHPKSRKVLCKGTEVILTPKEFDILYFLARNKGDVFTKEQIYKAVWEEDYLLADSNIMAFIRKLRKKIEPNPDEPEYILTIWGVGYKFNDKL